MGNRLRDISKIVIHCTDSPDDRDIGRAEVNDWHVERGWEEIGYHWLFRRSGMIELGRDETKVGAHVKDHNVDTIGIVLVGRDNFPAQQVIPAVVLVASLILRYGLKITDVVGHRELAPLSGKTCPNYDMNAFREHLKAYVPKEYHGDAAASA